VPVPQLLDSDFGSCVTAGRGATMVESSHSGCAGSYMGKSECVQYCAGV
jgi:hypothetical protein